MRDNYVVTVITPSGKKLTSDVIPLGDAVALVVELGTLYKLTGWVKYEQEPSHKSVAA